MPFLYGKTGYKELQINGLKIFTEKDLIKQAGITPFNKNKNHYKSVSEKIIKFYREKGYSLAKVFLINENSEILSLFIDEGSINRVIFKGLNSFDIMKMKYEFNLQQKIYNKYIVNNEISRIKKKYNYKDIKVKIERSVDGERALFQLDNTFNLPWVGDTRLPFFSKYSSDHNLIITLEKNDIEDSGGLSLGIRTSYSKGLIPSVNYSVPGLFGKKDRLNIMASMGWMYGLDFKFKEYPKWTFFELNTDYYFTPHFFKYYTPKASLQGYYSRSSRSDIGLSNYNYLLLESIFSPGVTLFEKLRIYIGAGGERVFIYKPKIDQNAEYIVDIEEETDVWAVFEDRVKIDLRPWSLKNASKHRFEAVFRYYMNSDIFYSLDIEMDGEFEFRNLDYYIFTIRFFRIWDDPPFYHEHSVSDSDFKGFMGQSLYTRNIIKSSNEYKISAYKDSFHVGFFADFTRFEGSGYDLYGYQNGIVAGIAGHLIFLDQFEFNIYYGKDYLFSTKDSQYNIYLNAKKKW